MCIAENRKYWGKGRVLLAALPAIRSCIRCKVCFRGAAGGGRRGGPGPYIFLFDNAALNAVVIVRVNAILEVCTTMRGDVASDVSMACRRLN